MKTRKFIDHVTLFAHAGNGGNGSASFRREKFVPKGGPDGGDGGRGGHVILRGDRDVDSLISIYFSPHQRAKHGGNGKGKQLHGKNGADRIVKVPLGTEVWDAETDVLLDDIVEHGQDCIVARGGRGGRGNVHWKSSTHQAPTEQTDGKRVDSATFRLELKIVADLGLIGFPNAGKSSLLTQISDAHPKVGAYPFTTLNPVIGTVIFEDYTRVTAADIPGLIEGAHEGVGLGHAFLRHVERSSYLIYVVDMAGVDGREPHDDYAKLRYEIKMHREDLVDRPSLIVANKMDLPDAEENLAEFRQETGTDPILFSAETGKGVPELKARIESLVRAARASAQSDAGK